MFCSTRQTNNVINKIHQRALRIVLNDHISDFETILRNMNDITIHHGNIQTLDWTLQIKYDLAPPIVDSMLNRKTICHNFRNLQEFHLERRRTVFYDLETISYRAPQLWTIFPEEFKQTQWIFLKAMSGNRYVMGVHADCAKYLYQT